MSSLAQSLINNAAEPTLLERILRRCIHNSETNCLTWIGGRATQGKYGVTTVDGGPELTHRAAFFAANGSVPEGSIKHESSSIEIHHDCTNRLCCNPDHLFSVTRAEHAAIHAGKAA